MTDIAVRCVNLSKRYRVRKGPRQPGRRREDFWALRDVSFDVAVGEVLGIVGRNGAGKSTLLKILSQISQPTSGTAAISGRLSGLLEVGTGFHHELTGRENIFLNGTMLGMTRREVKTHFDDIVDFAGVSYFLDTPVKRYSSGMYVRLAFAVAAHLRSEVVVLDEVLAVGDAAFQKKCLEKVDDLAHGSGRTVLIVSHNMEVVRQHATSGVLLRGGRVEEIGPIVDVLDAYEKSDRPFSAEVADAPRLDPSWGHKARLLRVEVLNGGVVPMYGDLVYRVGLDLQDRISLGVGQAVLTGDDRPVAVSFSPQQEMGPGPVSLEVRVPQVSLGPGEYALTIAIGMSSFAAPSLNLDCVQRAVGFSVVQPVDGRTVDWHPEWWGSCALAESQVAIREFL